MKNERFKQLCHFAAGLLLLPIAFKLFEHKRFAVSVVVLIGAVIFLSAAALLDWLEKRLGNTLKLLYILECIFLLFAASMYQLKLHKKMPAMAYAAAGIIYFLLFLYFLYDKDVSKKKRKKHRRHKHRSKQPDALATVQPDIAH